MQHKYVKSFDGTTIHYVVQRNKNKHFLVFLHGVGVNWTIWNKIIEFFDYAGYSIIAIDLRGHGMSETPIAAEKYVFSHFAKDVRAVLTKEKITLFSFIGHSLGGGIAIDYITQFQKKPKTMIVLDTAVTNPFAEKGFMNINQSVSKLLGFLVKHQKIKQKLQKKEIDLSKAYHKNKILFGMRMLKQCQLKVMVTILDKLTEYTRTHSEKSIKALQKLSIPVLVITSLYDKVVPAGNSEDISRYAKKAVFKIIKDVHHAIMLDKPDEVSTTILKFLENRKIKEYF